MGRLHVVVVQRRQRFGTRAGDGLAGRVERLVGASVVMMVIRDVVPRSQNARRDRARAGTRGERESRA